MSTKSIGQKVREAREKAELTRTQLANKLGLSVVYTGGIERDAAVIVSDETVKKLAKALPALKLTEKEIELKNESSRLAAKTYRAKRIKAEKKAKPAKPAPKSKKAKVPKEDPPAHTEVLSSQPGADLMQKVISGEITFDQAAEMTREKAVKAHAKSAG